MSESALPRASSNPSAYSGIGKAKVRPQGTGVGSKDPRVYPLLAISARPSTHEALANY